MSGADLAELLGRAQTGDELARETIVRSYANWSLRVAAKHCGRYLHADSDDEASIALMALDEAVLTYRANSGSSFPSFVAMVIKRRLIDHHRRESRHREIPFSAVNSPEQVEDEEGEERKQRSEEIAAFRAELNEYGITLQQLVQLSPKQRDARERAMSVAMTIAQEPKLCEYFHQHRELPLKQLDQVVNVSRKTLERQRRYIMAMVIVLCGDYGLLRSYFHESGQWGVVKHDQTGFSS